MTSKKSYMAENKTGPSILLKSRESYMVTREAWPNLSYNRKEGNTWYLTIWTSLQTFPLAFMDMNCQAFKIKRTRSIGRSILATVKPLTIKANVRCGRTVSTGLKMTKCSLATKEEEAILLSSSEESITKSRKKTRHVKKLWQESWLIQRTDAKPRKQASLKSDGLRRKGSQEVRKTL